MSRTFASLRIRNYRLFAGGQLVSLTGTWMQRVGQDWLVLRLTNNSGTAIGITTALQFLPILLLGLQGGVIADRFSKRKLILATQVTMGLIALALGLLDLVGAATLYDVYLFAFLLGVVTAVDNPTRQAFVSELVGGEEVEDLREGELDALAVVDERHLEDALLGVDSAMAGRSCLRMASSSGLLMPA